MQGLFIFGLLLLTTVGKICNGHSLQSEYKLIPRSSNEQRFKPIVESSFKDDQANAVERPLFIGSFNIQTLGKKKLSNTDVMVTVEKVVHRYDMILILELMTNETRLLDRFLRDVNNFAPKGVQYNMTMSIDPVVNEFCAIFYRVDKLRVLKSESYHDPKKFYRRPFFVLFDSPTLRDMKEFGVIGYHVKPSQAVQEINALAEVYDFMKMKYKIENILIMGDFNADCDYVKEQHWEKISLWMRPEFTWPIDVTAHTTTNYRSCALDRFVYAGEDMNAGVIMSSAKAFDYRDEFYVSLEEARRISDHWPIEIKIRGKVSKIVEKHLTSDTCFTIQDSRLLNVSREAVTKAARSAKFTVIGLPSGFSLYNETNEFEHMLDAMKRLRKVLPNALTHEQVETIMYKSNHGALDDSSSYADEPNSVFKLDISLSNGCSKILICRTTTIN